MAFPQHNPLKIKKKKKVTVKMVELLSDTHKGVKIILKTLLK